MMKKSLAALCGAVLALSACSGDDNNTPPTPAPTSSVPTSASESVGGYIAYLMALVTSSADTLEPVDVNSVTPPTSDTTEPVAIQ